MPEHPLPDDDVVRFRGRNDSLPPDPMYMALWRLLTTGPIGALRGRIERRIEAWEDRRYGPPMDDALQPGHELSPGEPNLAVGPDAPVTEEGTVPGMATISGHRAANADQLRRAG